MNVRDELVRAGAELLEHDGLDHVTLRAIARRAGVSHGAPRHHFPTYAGLLAAIARTGVEDLDAELTPALLLADPREALRDASLRYVRFAVARPEMFALIGRHDILEGAGGQLRSITGYWFGLLDERLRALDPAADRTVAMAIWSGVHGLAVILSRRAAGGVVGTVPAAEPVIDLLLERLTAPPTP
jgi:AcrR family transcriptional regulator